MTPDQMRGPVTVGPLAKLKGLAFRWLAHLRMFAYYALRRQGFLAEVGWFESWRARSAIDRDGNPIPWMTYPCIAFLGSRVRDDMEVFEYGSGQSTLWWARRVKAVVSCEHERAWYERMSERLPRNVDLHLRELGAGRGYAEFAGAFPGRFHVVAVDGRDRVRCVKSSLRALRADGVLVLDNSERPDYREATEFMLANGFRALDFWGPGPITTNAWCTTIFYRSGNCLGI
jgi:hypothetical protein